MNRPACTFELSGETRQEVTGLIKYTNIYESKWVLLRNIKFRCTHILHCTPLWDLMLTFPFLLKFVTEINQPVLHENHIKTPNNEVVAPTMPAAIYVNETDMM